MKSGESKARKPAKPDKKPAKPDGRSELVQVRVNEDEKAQFEAAADAEGLSLSAWIRQLGLRAVRQAAAESNSREDEG